MDCTDGAMGPRKRLLIGQHENVLQLIHTACPTLPHIEASHSSLAQSALHRRRSLIINH